MLKMSSKEKVHQEYCTIVNKINKISTSIDERNKRYEYLYTKVVEYIHTNKEQAEAYAYRAKMQKNKLLEEVKEKTELEIMLDSMPRVWIV